jgi:hypothetical protein
MLVIIVLCGVDVIVLNVTRVVSGVAETRALQAVFKLGTVDDKNVRLPRPSSAAGVAVGAVKRTWRPDPWNNLRRGAGHHQAPSSC